MQVGRHRKKASMEGFGMQVGRHRKNDENKKASKVSSIRVRLVMVNMMTLLMNACIEYLRIFVNACIV